MSTITATRSAAGFFERQVLNALSKMTLGKLDLYWPDGALISIGDGKGMHAEIRINNKEFFKCIALYGDIGFGEAYTQGIWDTPNITNVIKWVLANIENAPAVSGSKARSVLLNILKWVNKLSHIRRSNTLAGSQKNISEHYDLNNDFFALFLDPTMTYSSAYFKEEMLSLEEAQYAIIEHHQSQVQNLLNQYKAHIKIGASYVAPLKDNTELIRVTAMVSAFNNAATVTVLK
ncbi:MAG: hypothetical protein EOO89_12715, partial [Pedobacter sp.]